MNLIEQLGGYGEAKEGLHRLKSEQKDLLTCGALVVVKSELDSALLEYRRQHNFYEVGDQYVMLKLWHDDLMTVADGEMDEPWWNTRIIRHITNKEREAGHRLPD